MGAVVFAIEDLYVSKKIVLFYHDPAKFPKLYQGRFEVKSKGSPSNGCIKKHESIRYIVIITKVIPPKSIVARFA